MQGQDQVTDGTATAILPLTEEQGPRSGAGSKEGTYFTLEKSAGILTSFPSWRLMTNTDAALGSNFS